MQRLQPLYGLVFLFKWDKELEQKDDRPVTSSEDLPPNIFFAQQVINNACATQALLNIILNRPELEVGDDLKHFREFTAEYPFQLKGELIGQLESIRDAHNSFSRPEAIEIKQDDKDPSGGEAFHFVGYVQASGALWELDGLKQGPLNLGPCEEEDFIRKVRPAIQERMQRYSEKEIRFNLMALIKDRRLVLQEKLDALEKRKTELEGKPDAEAELQTLRTEEAELKEDLEDEEALRREWARENERRKHDYLPFIFNLLTELAKKDQLTPLLEEGKKEHKARRERREEEAKKEKQQQQQESTDQTSTQASK